MKEIGLIAGVIVISLGLFAVVRQNDPEYLRIQRVKKDVEFGEAFLQSEIERTHAERLAKIACGEPIEPTNMEKIEAARAAQANF